MKLRPSSIIQKQNADSSMQISRVRNKVMKDKVGERANKQVSHWKG